MGRRQSYLVNMKKAIATLIIGFSYLVASGHEFWLQPKKYHYNPGEEIKIDLMVGESFTGEYWDMNRHKVEKMQLHRISGVKDLTSSITKSKGNNLAFKADSEGTYLLAMQSNAAYLELPADEFNAYLNEDGLDQILDERKKLNQLDKPSRENYTRFAKLLVQVGTKQDETYKKKLGLRYEIVPEQNPYSLKTGDYLECKIYYEGKPAAFALVKVWSMINNTTFLQNIYTEKDGSFKFPIGTKGAWMVSSVKMIHAENKNADYHSLWASLVFGIQ
jgi:uncharacterized GH25 family protein